MFVHKHKLLPFLSEASGDSKNLHNIQNVLSLTIIRLHSGKVRGRSYLCITEDWCGGGSCHSLCFVSHGDCAHKLVALLTSIFVDFVDGEKTPLSVENHRFAL